MTDVIHQKEPLLFRYLLTKHSRFFNLDAYIHTRSDIDVEHYGQLRVSCAAFLNELKSLCRDQSGYGQRFNITSSQID